LKTISSRSNNDFGLKIFSEFIRASSYADDKSSGHVLVEGQEKLKDRLKGERVLVVEDIVDTGKTMKVNGAITNEK